MNKKHFLWRLFAVAFAAVLTFGLGACSDDDTDEGDFQLYYPEVTNFGPSMSYVSGNPSYVGGTPSAFAISALTFDGDPIESGCFSINELSGVISISNTEDLQPGIYRASVSCIVGARACNFVDVFVVNLLPAAPVELAVSAREVEIPYEESKDSETTVKITPEGESVSIIGYSLLQEEGKEYFAVTNAGVISVNSKFTGEILPGVYPLTVKCSTHAGDAVFEDLVTVRITSPALELTYAPAEGCMEYMMGYQSTAPAMKGSPEEVVYSVKAVTPETDGIAIDPATGVLSVAKDVELTVGTKYAVGVTVTNRYGATDFDGAFLLEVIGYIAPIDPDSFAYADVEMIQGTSFTAGKADGFEGAEVTFSLGELPAALQGRIAIDELTGTVSAANGNDIPLGAYEIPVRAVNAKSEATAVLKLSVVENPYYFTYISYGNNLDLPALEHASQFWCKNEKEYKALNLTPTTDAKPGTELEWSLEVVYRETTADNKYKGGQGSTIDPATGVITPDGFNYNDSKTKSALLYVTATAGKGKVGETTVKSPVFFIFSPENAPVHYAPFVFRVNPRKGGMSVAPNISSEIDPALFSMDYRRDFQFWGFDGQADGFPADNGSFMNWMWKVYNAQEGVGTKTIGTGAKGCVSAYENNSWNGKTLGLALLYVDPETKAVVVNPNKWIDESGKGANGVFIGEMTYLTDQSWTEITKAVNNNISKGSVVTPLMIWFDEKF
ncbi:surface glycan-binding family protein [uncultured Alistipes sp.]|uniref:surface glycan-binding family protein n=1 Tax=uncultured Alistipes sp. TaxID=538949 RepID=UPI002630EC02|nr:surface glycan-binding family protein [uncultured Alistipes sp.]